MDKQMILTLAALLLTSSAWGQSKQEGEVELSGGYGNTAPYASRLQLNLGEGKVVFKPFVGIKGLARHSSEQNLDEHYIFTGKMPLSETVGSQYYSHQTTEAKGMMADYGFQFAYRPTTQQTLTVSLRGESLHKDERGTLAERLLAPDGAPLAKTRWRLDNPLLRSNHLEVGADYTCRFKRDDVTLSYKYQRDRDEAERQLEALQLEGFSDFQATLTTADATVHHHDLRLIYNTQALLGHLRLVARYENRLAESDDQQWIDDCLAQDSHFRHRYQTAAASFLYDVHPDRQKRLGLTAGLEFAYTDMAGKKLRDFLPTGRIGWQVSRTSQLALGYNRRLVRPSLTLLNPVVLRTPFAVRQGNKDLEGLHANVFALSFTHDDPIFSWGMSLSYTMSNDGFNGIWMERDNRRIYQWGNEGKRRAWSIQPDFTLHASTTTKVRGQAVILWDKRIADAVSMAKEHWGVFSRLGVEQMLCATFRLNAFAEYSEGNTQDLYRHMGSACRLGTTLCKSFGDHFSTSLEYQYARQAKEVYTHGGYTGSYHLYSARRNACSLSLKYKF